MNASAFRSFVQTEYKIRYWSSQQRDGARKKPQISAGTIFEAMVFRAAIGARSTLQLDQQGRFAPLKQLVGSSRELVASDSTMLRAASEWDLGRARMANYATHVRMRQQGLAKKFLSSGRRVCLAVVDGSDFGGHNASVLGFAGQIYQAVDLEPSEGRGHELITSRALLLRAGEQLGYGFATHVLYDGLMADRIDLRFVRKALRSHLVVKTQEETLEIIQSSRQAWTKMSETDLKRNGVEIVRGVDVGRGGMIYEIHAQGGITWDGLELPLKLAWVKEKHLKGKYKGQTLEFWVITTDESLRAEELREIAHCRWAIENNGFKELNEQMGSKTKYLKDPIAKQATLLMGFLGMALLKAFVLFLGTLDEWHRSTVRKTKKLVGLAILLGLSAQAPETGPPQETAVA